jgi:hypothetical protein
MDRLADPVTSFPGPNFVGAGMWNLQYCDSVGEVKKHKAFLQANVLAIEVMI